MACQHLTYQITGMNRKQSFLLKTNYRYIKKRLAQFHFLFYNIVNLLTNRKKNYHWEVKVTKSPQVTIIVLLLLVEEKRTEHLPGRFNYF